ncbi:unnamed protein product [Lepeophtheirus salmonis]|uniref:XK-related protein n=1 Tax=Lepeophtheirus salmonis TaxID=72036 RepID=A0A7R8CMK9_LEPSM|nr:unnamed protein product [Lepeophtheirus salmonis]CAF2866139.1 unnamed protein product [Lepeophtheirus salmonis]
MEEDSERMNETAHLKEHLNFTYYGAALIICSILTYLVDISLDTMVALSYFQKGELIYSLVTILLILIPAICIQIFSIRWLQMDLDPEESLSKREVIVHLGLIGIIHRYFESLKLGLKAKKTGNPLDYQLYYHNKKDLRYNILDHSKIHVLQKEDSLLKKNSEDEPAIESPQDKPDSAYGTDSSQTISRNVLNETIGGETNCSFTPNNETYMSIEKSTPMAASTVLEDNNENTDASYMSVRPDSAPLNDNDTYMSVNSPVIINSSQDSTISNDSLITVINRKNTLIARANKAANINSETLLKRSPVLVQRKKRDFTIIVPPIPRLKKHDAPPKLPPKSMSSKTRSQYDDDDLFSGPHDYENMALVNINRGGIGVSHWKTYSDMASFQHDDSGSTERKQYSTSSSTDYESMHYYDVYPLSKKLQDKLVKNLNSTSPESDTYEPIEVFEPNKEEDDDYELRVPVPITLIHHDGEKIVTERVMSMENLKDVIAKHETVPMDDPQDRSDLYLLAPMRILEPILEESEPGDISNKSIMTVLSDLLNKTYASSSTYHPSIYSDGRFTHNIEAGGSSLVQTIEEIRNQSLYSSEPRPKIPPRQDSVAPDPHRDKKIPISTYVGNGEKTPENNHQENNEIPLSPSVKYEDNSTPTPPPFSRHVQNRAPCRRKFSIIRERYEVSIEDLQYESSATLRPDEKYENFSSTRSRGSWNCSSLQPKNIMDSNSLSQRNIHARRSMSILDDKENEAPHYSTFST